MSQFQFSQGMMTIVETTVPADHNEKFFTGTKRILATHGATRLKPLILRSYFSERMNIVINFCFRLLPANREIVVGLEINPELRRNAEKSSESQSHFRRDAPLFFNNLVYGRRSYSQSDSELIGVQIERDHEFFSKYFPWMNRL